MLRYLHGTTPTGLWCMALASTGAFLFVGRVVLRQGNLNIDLSLRVSTMAGGEPSSEHRSFLPIMGRVQKSMGYRPVVYLLHNYLLEAQSNLGESVSAPQSSQSGEHVLT